MMCLIPACVHEIQDNLNFLLMMVRKILVLMITLRLLSFVITGIPASWGGWHSQVHSDCSSEESPHKAFSSWCPWKCSTWSATSRYLKYLWSTRFTLDMLFLSLSLSLQGLLWTQKLCTQGTMISTCVLKQGWL
jgi:hypothetical protein